jgi:four helix bundle protein
MELVIETYKIVKTYPKEEQFALTSQTKRAALSVVSNIAEGIGRQYKKDTIQFLHISRGSLYELETQLSIDARLNMIDEQPFDSINQLITKCLQALSGLINYFERSTLK